MYRTLGFGALLLAMVVLVPADAHAQKKKGKKKLDTAEIATAQDYAALSQLKEVTGKLMFAEPSAENLTLRLDYPHIEANPNYKPNKANNNLYQQMQRVMNDQAALARTTNPVQRQQRMRQLAQDMQKLQQQLVGAAKGSPQNLPYRIVTDSKDFELPVEDKVVVRRLNLPSAYDDKGNFIEYTKEQIEKLRGKDKSKPGYEAKLEDLITGQIVKLTLKAPKKVSTSAKEKDDEAPTTADRKPRVTMIVIVQDVTDSLSKPGDQKKKKK